MLFIRGMADKILAVPMLFDAYQWLVGAPRCHRYFIENYVRARPGERVLDIGCGVGASLQHLPEGIDYVGFDISADYIKQAQKRWNGRGRFFCADVNDFDPTSFGSFDKAFSFGVLHHLDDQTASCVFGLAGRALKESGTLSTIDPCYRQGQNPVAHFLIEHDRGRYVRTQEGYVGIAEKYGKVRPALEENLLNVPYTQLVLQVSYG